VIPYGTWVPVAVHEFQRIFYRKLVFMRDRSLYQHQLSLRPHARGAWFIPSLRGSPSRKSHQVLFAQNTSHLIQQVVKAVDEQGHASRLKSALTVTLG